jgi:hypothetical protein
MRSAGIGHAEFHCRYHVQFRARHGSHWHGTYKAADLKPYLASAAEWINHHRAELPVALSLRGLQGLLDGAGQPEDAQNIKRRTGAEKARVAFARLREAGIEAERLLAVHLAVAALIEDDRGSHRAEEFRQVQTAKALHRLASGTHKGWEWPMPDGTTRPIESHAYPRSSGVVLRVMGRELDEICGSVSEFAREVVIALRTEKFGPHPSKLPGWKPEWQVKAEVVSATKGEVPKNKKPGAGKQGIGRSLKDWLGLPDT